MTSALACELKGCIIQNLKENQIMVNYEVVSGDYESHVLSPYGLDTITNSIPMEDIEAIEDFEDPLMMYGGRLRNHMLGHDSNRGGIDMILF